MTVSEFVKEGNRVYFDRYRAGFFFYTIRHIITRDEYEFFIPIEDIGEATLYGDDKALTYMRWIRKAIEDKTLIKI
jgi:hypothetical protein